MFTVHTKKTGLLLVLVLLALITNAGVGIRPRLITKNMELTVLGNNTVQIKTSLVTISNETFEIEKSYDNKNFTTIAIVFAYDVTEAYKPLLMKDKVDNGSKKVYYRVKKIQDKKVTYILAKNIAL